MAKLKLVFPDGREQEYQINRSVTMIGRTSDNDLKVVDRGISRKQCKIEGTPGNYSVVDLDSKNGTLVNGTKISTSQLRNDDVIIIGRVKMVFLEDDSPLPGTGKKGHECPSCGKDLKSGDVLCVKCGTFIKKSKSFFEGKSGLRDNWISWVILGVVVIILLVGGYLLVKGRDAGRAISETDRKSRIIEIIRALQVPTQDKIYGELFDELNIANSDIEWDIDHKGSQIYRVVTSFDTEQGEKQMVFKVDLEAGEAIDMLDEFTFEDF